MLSDPQSVKIGQTAATFTGGTTVSLPRTGSGIDSGAFRSADGNNSLTINHSTGKGRQRDSIRLYNRKLASDPFDSSVNAQYDMAVSVTIDHPLVGYTIAEAKAVVDGLLTQLCQSSGALVTQLLGGES